MTFVLKLRITIKKSLYYSFNFGMCKMSAFNALGSKFTGFLWKEDGIKKSIRVRNLTHSIFKLFEWFPDATSEFSICIRHIIPLICTSSTRVDRSRFSVFWKILCFKNNLRNKNVANRHVAAHFMYRTLFGLFSFFSLVSYISPILYYALHVKYSAEMSKSQLKVHYIFDVTNE